VEIKNREGKSGGILLLREGYFGDASAGPGLIQPGRSPKEEREFGKKKQTGLKR